VSRSGSGGGVGPRARYAGLVETGRLTADPAQQHLADVLQRCHDALVHQRDGWFRRAARVPGVYIHGGVGRGKTLLMDLFAQSLREAGVAVERCHFHRFMDRVHADLKGLGARSGPLTDIATALRKQVRVVCFDEFHVDDIADAMILGELSRQWFELGMTLVATSNQAPDALYAGGLQRDRFLPAIDNIKRNCRVVELAAAEDFRLRELERHPTWYTPADEAAEAQLAEEFDALSPDQPIECDALSVRGRRLPIRKRAGSLLWADFDQLCEGPRGAADYIELSFRFSTLIISRIPGLDDDRNNAARRFIHLIDECYDRAVKVIASADAPIDRLYTGKRLAAPFERTVSRLIEMQSADYLGRAHRPRHSPSSRDRAAEPGISD